MLIGIDFDNTLVCYDEVFYSTARERGLVPAEISKTKTSVRDHLRKEGNEPTWTELQGIVYGPKLLEAEPFPGAIEFINSCSRRGIPVAIVSHKTRQPIVGPCYDLHAAARSWIAHYLLADLDLLNRCYFEITKEAKLARIGQLECTHFVDDLPEVLRHSNFPAGVQKILFDPHGANRDPSLRSVQSFGELTKLL